MCALFILSGMACTFLTLLYIRLCLDIRSLCGQLREIGQGSHLELAVGSRQRVLLTLCRTLNQVLSSKDRNHIQYEKAERQLKQNITNLAHDIRTPLTGACGYIQLAGECENSEKREHYLQAASARLTELEDMLEKLFLYTKLTNEEFSFSRDSMRKVPVYPLLENCLLSFYTEFEEKVVTPEVFFSSKDFRVLADEDALRRIFLNLIQNALVHGAGGLAVSQYETDSVPVLIFENPVRTDNPPDPTQMFERFYKADPVRGKNSSGLGLFIVREFMRKMDGAAEAELHNNMLRIILYFPTQPDRIS